MMAPRAGDWVQVRSKEEILRTLDKDGRLEKMPFMPEMFELCGKKMRVHKRAHKSCDTQNPLSTRSLTDSVILAEYRCNGSAHAGCQAQCSVFWKDAWLKPVEGEAPPLADSGAGCTEEDVAKAVRGPDGPDGEPRYRCQSTDFPMYSTRIRTRDLGQYVEDYTSGNTTLKNMVMTASYFFFKWIGRPNYYADGGGYRKFYDWFQGLWGGVPYPRRPGKIPLGKPQPKEDLNLQPGDLVRVKSHEEILATLNVDSKNRGLFFDAEMIPFCGGTFRVRGRVETFLDEKTGAVLTMKTPAVILEGSWCRSRFSAYRVFCPRLIYSWWRECWLERAPEGAEMSIANCLGRNEILKNINSEPVS
jgi:hypothetical protein